MIKHLICLSPKGDTLKTFPVQLHPIVHLRTHHNTNAPVMLGVADLIGPPVNLTKKKEREKTFRKAARK